MVLNGGDCAVILNTTGFQFFNILVWVYKTLLDAKYQCVPTQYSCSVFLSFVFVPAIELFSYHVSFKQYKMLSRY